MALPWNGGQKKTEPVEAGAVRGRSDPGYAERSDPSARPCGPCAATPSPLFVDRVGRVGPTSEAPPRERPSHNSIHEQAPSLLIGFPSVSPLHHL